MKSKTIRQAIYLGILAVIFVIAARAQKEELKLEILNGHSSGITSVAVSSNGKYALTGSTDWTALLWNLETGKQLRRFGGNEFEGHEFHVLSVAFSQDRQYVLTGSGDKSARLWRTETGKQVQIFKEHTGRVVSAAISADNKFIITASDDMTARIWDAKNGRQLFVIPYQGKVNSVAFSPDGQYFLTGGEDKIIRMYKTESPDKSIKEFVGHTGEIKSVTFSPDGSQILSGGDITVRLWNSQSSVEIYKLELDNSVLSVCFTLSGKNIVAGTNDTRSVYLLDTATGKTIRKIPERGSAVAATESEILITEGNIWSSNIVSIYKFAEKQNLISVEGQVDQFPEQPRFLRGKSDSINKIAVSPDFHSVVSGANNDTSGLWNLMTGKMWQWWKEDKKKDFKNSSNNKAPDIEIKRINYVPDLKKEVSNYSNISGGDAFIEPDNNIRIVAYSPDSKWFAADWAKNTCVIFDTLSGKSLQQFSGHKDDVLTIAISPNGKLVLTGSGDKTARLWQVNENAQGEKTDSALREFIGHQSFINSVAYSPDGKTIATASGDLTVRLWNAETGEVKRILEGFKTYIGEVEFSPDGKTLATASGTYTPNSDNIIRLWSVETGREIRRYGDDVAPALSGHTAGFPTLAFSPDGRFLIGGSYDGKSFLWETATGTEIRRFEIHQDTVTSVRFSADQRFIITGSRDSTTRIWNAATGEEICKLVTFRDGTWAVIDRFGRYDAPNGGEIEGIQWVYGNETIALNQLKDIYYTPNLLPRLLGYNNDPLRPVPDLAKLKLFPKIVEQKLDEANARLNVKLENRGGGIGEVLVKINGKLAAADARSEKQKADWNAKEMTIDFNLQGSAGFDPKAKNKIEVITNNYDPAIKKGYISSKGTDIIYLGNAEDELPKPTLYAVVAGVSDYVGSQIDLNFAAKDAEDFAHALGIGARRLFCPQENQTCDDKVKIKLLTTSEKDKSKYPTKENIKNAFAEIAKEARPEDILVVYLSGHGASLTLNDTDTYFYLAQDADKASKEALQNPEYRQTAAISSDELLDWLTQTEWRTGKKGIDAQKQVMILDTCAAGAFEGKFTAAGKTKDLSADQIRALERLKDRSGFQILMGSAANQSSYEASQYGQGLLTYALLEGIKGAALQNQTRIETATLFDYAVNRVPKMDIAGGNGGLQQPRVFGATSIPIGLILTQADKDSIKLESVKPVILRPRFSTGAEGDDDLGLIGVLRKKFEEASEIKPRGDGDGGGRTALLVYVDDDSFPGAYRVTGTYETDASGQVTITPFLRKDGKTVVNLEKVSGKDASEAAEKLLDAILKALKDLTD